MSHIIAYTYEADVHCPHCTGNARNAGHLRVNDSHPHAVDAAYLPESRRDEHNLRYNLVDRKGNLVLPVFDTDKQFGTTACGDCGAQVSEGPTVPGGPTPIAVPMRKYRVYRDQGVWERETFEIEVPDGLQYKDVVDFINEVMDTNPPESIDVEVIGEVEGMDVQITIDGEIT